MIEYRELDKKDIPQVIEIYAQGIEAGRSTFNTEIPSAEAWDKNHLEYCRLGAYDGNILVGWSALQATSSRECYKGVCEVSLYLREGYRGEGIGTKLMRKTVEESEKLGIWTLYAAIFSTNTRSIRMCEKNGWRVVGSRENIAKDRFGVWQSTTIMERRSKTVGID